MGAILGQLTNIDERGQASMGFHGDPSIMQHDPYRYGVATLAVFADWLFCTGCVPLLLLLRVPDLACLDGSAGGSSLEQ